MARVMVMLAAGLLVCCQLIAAIASIQPPVHRPWRPGEYIDELDDKTTWNEEEQHSEWKDAAQENFRNNVDRDETNEVGKEFQNNPDNDQRGSRNELSEITYDVAARVDVGRMPSMKSNSRRRSYNEHRKFRQTSKESRHHSQSSSWPKSDSENIRYFSKETSHSRNHLTEVSLDDNANSRNGTNDDLEEVTYEGKYLKSRSKSTERFSSSRWRNSLQRSYDNKENFRKISELEEVSYDIKKRYITISRDRDDPPRTSSLAADFEKKPFDNKDILTSKPKSKQRSYRHNARDGTKVKSHRKKGMFKKKENLGEMSLAIKFTPRPNSKSVDAHGGIYSTNAVLEGHDNSKQRLPISRDGISRSRSRSIGLKSAIYTKIQSLNNQAMRQNKSINANTHKKEKSADYFRFRKRPKDPFKRQSQLH